MSKDEVTPPATRRELLRRIAVGGGALAVAGAGCGSPAAADHDAAADPADGPGPGPDSGWGADASADVPDAGAPAVPPVPSSIYNVKTFGAVGDASADDTAAIQSALDAAAAAPFGGVVYVPAGVYLITNTLVVRSRTHLHGDGIGLTILRGSVPNYAGKVVDGHELYATVAVVASHRVVIEQLTVDHITHQTWANGIVLVPDGTLGSGNPCRHCVVRDCEVLGWNTHQYLIWNLRGEHVRILDNYLDGFAGTSDPGSIQEGIESLGGHDVLIEGNTVLRIGNAAINITPAVGVADAGCDGIRVVHNYVEAAKIGIYLGTSWDAINGAQNLSQIRVTGNVIRSTWQDGIKLSTPISGTTLTDVRIASNSIFDADVGITLYGIETETTHRGVAVDGNTVTGSRAPTTGGISTFFISNVAISNNAVVDSTGVGIWVYASHNAMVVANSVDIAARNAIACHASSGVYVTDNRLHRYNSDGGHPGLLLSSITGGVVRGNTFFEEYDHLPMAVDSTSDEVRVTGNSLLYQSQLEEPYALAGSNPNFGVASIGAGETTIDVMNTLVNGCSRFVVTQEEGTIVGFRVSPISGGFRITTASPAAGDETFRWEILR